MVTAELALALPVLVAVLLVGVGIVAIAGAALRCADAARLGARAVARGDPAADVRALAQREAPGGARVAVAPAGDLVGVGVSVALRLPGPLGGLLPAWTVREQAAALPEPAADGS